MPIALLAIWACGERMGEVVVDQPHTEPEASAPTQPEDEGPVMVDTPEPAWQAEELELALNAALQGGLPDPYLPRQAYEAMFADHADGSCPGGEGMNLPGDYEGCTAEDGSFFFGHGELALEAEPGALESFYLLGDFYMIDPEGQRFDGAGEVLHATYDDGEFLLFETLVTGTWSYGPAGSWMSSPSSMSLWVFGDHWGDKYHGTLHGSVELDGLPIFFDWVNFQSLSCPASAMEGGIQIRDPSGYWYQIHLDSSSYCNGCGTLYWADGTNLGEVCPDFGDSLEVLMSSTLDETVARWR